MVRLLTISIWMIILLLFILFVSINSQFVLVHYYFGQVKAYFPLVLFVFLLFGSFLSLFVFIPLWFRFKKTQRQLINTIKDLKGEIINLRNIPIKDIH